MQKSVENVEISRIDRPDPLFLGIRVKRRLSYCATIPTQHTQDGESMQPTLIQRLVFEGMFQLERVKKNNKNTIGVVFCNILCISRRLLFYRH